MYNYKNSKRTICTNLSNRKKELKAQETQEKIDEYKKQKYKVGIFVTGKENYPEVLNKIVTKQVELSDNVC